jgi:aspartyl-tRNA(Asn)/glutamyl-tRNA(Gln) amidotransferase subunit B
MEKSYYPTIGLEVHAELKTASKMFCGCKNDPDEKRPNVNVCPVCMAHPGAIPVPNKKAMESVVRVGLAIGGQIADFTEFDRKNYFYPDIPKGYQISQYEYPIVKGGTLGGMAITRVHLEEDTGTSKHDRGAFSLVDYNRAGVPLMELVTEPHTFSSIEEAAKVGGAFGKELQLLLWYLDVSEANMEKGEMRVEANISISDDKEKYGTKVEVKNLNSFRSVERAIAYELTRMRALLEEGRGVEIVQETRGWDENKQSTFSQRTKESAQDYRYFPDPDIPKFKLSELFDSATLAAELPELPAQKRIRYAENYGIKAEDIETYVSDPHLAAWFESIAALLGDAQKIQTASNYITSDFLGMRKNKPDIQMPKAEHMAELIGLVADGLLSSRGAKDILGKIVVTDGSPKEIAEKEGLLQKNDEGALLEMVQRLIAAHPTVVADYKAGKEASLQFLVGQAMKETRGSANPGILIKLFKEQLA